jgi:hypothetical protein
MSFSANSKSHSKRTTKNSNKNSIETLNSSNSIKTLSRKLVETPSSPASTNSSTSKRSVVTSKSPVVATKSSVSTTKTPVSGESLVQSTQKDNLINRPNLTAKPMQDITISTAGSMYTAHVPTYAETVIGAFGSDQGMGFFPRAPALSTALNPVNNTSQIQFGGGNKVFSALNVLQRAEKGDSMVLSSNSNIPQHPQIHVKTETSHRSSHTVPTPREDKHAQESSRHDSKHQKDAKTPSGHSSKRKTSRLKLSK